MNTDYQIQDSEQNTAVVRLIRDNAYKVLAWQNQTPGAFAPSIGAGASYSGQEAHRTVSAAHGQSLACGWTYETGETVGALAMHQFFVGGSEFSLLQGTGMLFEKGVLGGKLKAGPMTWSKLIPDSN